MPPPGVWIAAEAFNCKFKDDSAEYDLNILTRSPLNITSATSTPPSTTISTTLISLCSPLDPALFKDDPEADRCPTGTRVCTRLYNERNGDRRIVSVVPVATQDEGGKIERQRNRDDAWSLTLYGPAYASVRQSMELSLFCAKDGAPDRPPTELVYDAASGVLKGEWTAAAACGTASSGDDRREEPGKGEAGRDGPYDPAGRAAGGWIGTFFLLLLIGLVAYFAIGFYHNYNQFGVIEPPHKDFWRELPLTIRDLLFRRRPGRGGYSALS